MAKMPLHPWVILMQTGRRLQQKIRSKLDLLRFREKRINLSATLPIHRILSAQAGRILDLNGLDGLAGVGFHRDTPNPKIASQTGIFRLQHRFVLALIADR
jgi:hypothetical protein